MDYNKSLVEPFYSQKAEELGIRGYSSAGQQPHPCWEEMFH